MVNGNVTTSCTCYVHMHNFITLQFKAPDYESKTFKLSNSITGTFVNLNHQVRIENQCGFKLLIEIEMKTQVCFLPGEYPSVSACRLAWSLVYI